MEMILLISSLILGCKNKLVDIFKILFFETYESKMSDYCTLNDQIFEFKKSNLLEIKKIWMNCLENPVKCPEIENKKIMLIMKNAYEGFISYLKN